MSNIQGATDSREISNEIKDAAKTSGIQEYGESKLPCGDISGREVIVVEGRADVLNLLRNRVNNAIAMNGTKLPEDIKELSKSKELTLFVDGDRGGKLIVQNVVDNAKVKYVAVAPDGKEVEELTGKEILMQLRKKMPVEEFSSKSPGARNFSEKTETKKLSLSSKDKEKLKELSKENEGSGRAILLNQRLEEIKKVSAKTLGGALKRLSEKPFVLVVDGTVTSPIMKSAEEAHVQVIVAKNFATTETNIELLSL